MNKLAFAVSIFAMSAVSATAADMAPRYAKAAPIVMPVYTWTGCYVGGNIGAAWSRTSTTAVDLSAPSVTDAGSHNATGFVGGGQIGCDYQFASNWVLGVQGVFNGADVRGSHLASFAFAGTNTETISSKVDWFTTATVRLGYVVTPQTLLYVKGGAAWVNTRYSDTDPSGTSFVPFSGGASATRTGWTVGVGGEYKFTPNWSVFAEYNYVDLRSKTSAYNYSCTGTCDFSNPYLYSNKQDFETFLVGLNYRFGY